MRRISCESLKLGLLKGRCFGIVLFGDAPIAYARKLAAKHTMAVADFSSCWNLNDGIHSSVCRFSPPKCAKSFSGATVVKKGLEQSHTGQGPKAGWQDT